MSRRLVPVFIFVFLFILFVSCNKQIRETPEIELVESIPAETTLDNPDVRKTHDVWLEMINKAKETIDVEEYYIKNKQGEPLEDIIDAFIKASGRGVNIRILADSKMYQTYPETVDLLSKQKNIQCRLINFGVITGGIQHAKFFIIDNEEIFIGSQNFDWRSLKHVHEIGVRVKDHDFVEVYESIFDHDWIFANNNQSYPDFKNTDIISPVYKFFSPKYDTVTIVPSFSPQNYIPVKLDWDETQILRLIYNAKQTVLLQFLTYNPMGYDKKYYGALDTALMIASKRGIKVNMIVSDWRIGKKQIEYLKKFSSYPNIEIKYSSIPDWTGGYVSYSRVEHCKYIVSDSNSCWIGSCNAEKSYFYNTRNVGIVINNKIFSTRMYDIFMKDWKSSYTHQITPEGEYEAREYGEKR
jgi:phosphatidylserine/phosphatidylglycerophosphate/cardiolipin synthase-like enzyme